MSDKTRDIERELFIDAPPERVFEAFTEAESLVRWFAPFAETAPGLDGYVNLSWNEDGFQKDCEIRAWEPPRHFEVAWYAGPDGDRMLPLVVDLVPDGSGTRLKLVHHGFLSDESWDDEYESHGRGWSYELLSLKYYLEHQLGNARRYVVQRLPVPGDRVAAWAALLGESGAFSYDEAGGQLRLPDGRRTGARVLMEAAGMDFAAVADVLEGGLFRFALENVAGQPELWLWAFSWHLAQEELERLAQPWFDSVDDRLRKVAAADRDVTVRA